MLIYVFKPYRNPPFPAFFRQLLPASERAERLHSVGKKGLPASNVQSGKGTARPDFSRPVRKPGPRIPGSTEDKTHLTADKARRVHFFVLLLAAITTFPLYLYSV